MFALEVAIFNTIRLRATERLKAPRETSFRENSGSCRCKTASGPSIGRSPLGSSRCRQIHWKPSVVE